MRYFLIAYTWTAIENSGNGSVTLSSGKMPSLKKLKAGIKLTKGCQGIQRDIQDICINTIFEFKSKKDYLNYVEE